MFQWLQIRTHLLIAKYESPLLRKSSCFLNCVSQDEKQGHWPVLTQTAERSLPGPVFTTMGLRAPFLVIHMIGFDQGCPLNLLLWTSFSDQTKRLPRKVWAVTSRLSIFPAVHFSRGGPGERREGVAVQEVGVTEVLGPQRRCHLRLWRSARSLEVSRAESRPLLPISLCLGERELTRVLSSRHLAGHIKGSYRVYITFSSLKEA